jgi:hypothetical protein
MVASKHPSQRARFALAWQRVQGFLDWFQSATPIPSRPWSGLALPLRRELCGNRGAAQPAPAWRIGMKRYVGVPSLMVAAWLCSTESRADATELTILHVNDTHSHLAGKLKRRRGQPNTAHAFQLAGLVRSARPGSSGLRVTRRIRTGR